MKKSERMAVVVYSEFSRDARVRKAVLAAIENGFQVDCYSLKEKKHEDNVLHNFRLISTRISQYRGGSKVAYIYSYLNFFIRVMLKLSINHLCRRYSIVHVHNMPDILVFCAFLPKVTGAKIILDIHDSMPKVFVDKFSKSKVVLDILRLQERISAWFANKVITVHEPYKKEVLGKNGIPLKKIKVIKNLADDTLFLARDIERSFFFTPFSMVFHGTIAERYGLRTVIEGLSIVKKNNIDFTFDIYGKGDDVVYLSNLVRQRGLESNVTFHGLVPLLEIPSLIGKAHLGIASLDELEDGLSVKLLEYVALNIPVLTTSNHVIDYYFEEGDLFFYQKRNPISFSQAITELIENRDLLFENAQRLKRVSSNYKWAEEKNKLRKIYSELT